MEASEFSSKVLVSHATDYERTMHQSRYSLTLAKYDIGIFVVISPQDNAMKSCITLRSLDSDVCDHSSLYLQICHYV